MKTVALRCPWLGKNALAIFVAVLVFGGSIPAPIDAQAIRAGSGKASISDTISPLIGGIEDTQGDTTLKAGVAGRGLRENVVESPNETIDSKIDSGESVVARDLIYAGCNNFDYSTCCEVDENSKKPFCCLWAKCPIPSPKPVQKPAPRPVSNPVQEPSPRPTPSVPTPSEVCVKRTIDFSEAADGTEVSPGDYVSDEWQKFGLTLSASGGYGELPRVFDTSNPVDNGFGDLDLGSPNERCDDPGPGIGEGGEPGEEGENCSPLGNALIVQEENDNLEVPDDNQDGGMIVLDFKEIAEYVQEIGLLDVDYKTKVSVVYKTPNGAMTTKNINVPVLGDNSYQVLPINLSNVRQVKITMMRSGAVTSISFCPPSMPGPEPAPMSALLPTKSPTKLPIKSPTGSPITSPSASPTALPTGSPAASSTSSPTGSATTSPTKSPTALPTSSPKTTISGNVTDTSSNPLPGAIITLTKSNGDVIATAITGTDGKYKLIGLPPGMYTIKEKNPPRYIDFSPSIVDVTLAPGKDKVVSFVDTLPATVSGNVTDTSNNPLPGAILTVTNTNGDAIATAITGIDGKYKLKGLEPGMYTVKEKNPPGYIDFSRSIVDVTLAPGTDKVVNFVDTLPTASPTGSPTASPTASPTKSPTASPTASRKAIISGNVTDTSNNPLPGAILTVTNSNGDVIATAITGTDGKYKLIGLPPGMYTVKEKNPPGYIDFSPSIVGVTLTPGKDKVISFVDTLPATVSGSVKDTSNNPLPGAVITLTTSNGDVIATAATGTDGRYKVIGLEPGMYTVKEKNPPGYIDFGPSIVDVTVAPGKDKVVNFVDTLPATISGSVKDTSNKPLPRAILTVTNSNGDVIATAITGTDGKYKFIGLEPGMYTVKEKNPPGYIDFGRSIVDVTLVPGKDKVVTFVDTLPATVSGSVKDASNNPLPGAVITLTTSNGDVIATAVTGTDGKYKLIGLEPGTYTVKEKNPPGYIDFGPSIVDVTLAPGKDKVVNFVDTLPATISGIVRDTSNNPLPGAVITLTISNGDVIDTAATGTDGRYKFIGLEPGMYTVKEKNPPGYFDVGRSIVDVTLAPGGKKVVNFVDTLPTDSPTESPTGLPTASPSDSPTASPTISPVFIAPPNLTPTPKPAQKPTFDLSKCCEPENSGSNGKSGKGDDDSDDDDDDGKGKSGKGKGKGGSRGKSGSKGSKGGSKGKSRSKGGSKGKSGSTDNESGSGDSESGSRGSVRKPPYCSFISKPELLEICSDFGKSGKGDDDDDSDDDDDGKGKSSKGKGKGKGGSSKSGKGKGGKGKGK